MPFTLSHAAAVLPLRACGATRLPLAALMIGSMAPDFAYFLPIDLGRSTHTLAALLWFCLPLGLALWLLYTRIMERPTLDLLPEQWRARFTPTPRGITANSLALAAVAVVVGAFTHIAWDSFTHAHTPVVRAFPFLDAPVAEIGGQTLRVHWLLQHLSTLVGAVALLIWAIRLPRKDVAAHDGERLTAGLPGHAFYVAVLLVLVAAGTMSVAGFLGAAGWPLQGRLFELAIGGMTGGATAWFFIAVWIQWRWRARRQLSAPPPPACS